MCVVVEGSFIEIYNHFTVFRAQPMSSFIILNVVTTRVPNLIHCTSKRKRRIFSLKLKFKFRADTTLLEFVESLFRRHKGLDSAPIRGKYWLVGSSLCFLSTSLLRKFKGVHTITARFLMVCATRFSSTNLTRFSRGIDMQVCCLFVRSVIYRTIGVLQDSFELRHCIT